MRDTTVDLDTTGYGIAAVTASSAAVVGVNAARAAIISTATAIGRQRTHYQQISGQLCRYFTAVDSDAVSFSISAGRQLLFSSSFYISSIDALIYSLYFQLSAFENNGAVISL